MQRSGNSLPILLRYRILPAMDARSGAYSIWNIQEENTEKIFSVIIMYCPECGAENKENAKFCLECGSRIKQITRSSDNMVNPRNRESSSPSFALIVIGILIIAAMYTIPFFHVMWTDYTLSSIASLCDNPLFSFLSGSTCQGYKMFFYIGWTVGIIVIASGFFFLMEKEKHDR